MKEIPLTQGKAALVDDADFDAVKAHKWHACKRGQIFYAGRTVRGPDGKKRTLFLHQFLLPGLPKIDHREGDGLNNQRHNLRPATHSQNQQGFQKKRLGTTSKFRGVSWCRRRLKWTARIKVSGVYKFLGYFNSEEAAARAYDAAACKYFGDFASLNFKQLK